LCNLSQAVEFKKLSLSVKNEDMKGTEQFKEVIQNYLNNFALSDSVFTEKLKDKNKSIDNCIQYILNEVKKSGLNGFTDDEIFGMAIHYYDESEIDIGKPVTNVKVVTNQSVGKSKEKATKAVKSIKKVKAVDTIKKGSQVTIFDLGA
jgi:hypothetical protein